MLLCVLNSYILGDGRDGLGGCICCALGTGIGGCIGGLIIRVFGGCICGGVPGTGIGGGRYGLGGCICGIPLGGL